MAFIKIRIKGREGKGRREQLTFHLCKSASTNETLQPNLFSFFAKMARRSGTKRADRRWPLAHVCFHADKTNINKYWIFKMAGQSEMYRFKETNKGEKGKVIIYFTWC
jgi:hypothetical protein